MDEYEFTDAEQAAIEKSAQRLGHVMVDLDAIDAAYDIARQIHDVLAVTALEQAAHDVIAHRDKIRAIRSGDLRNVGRLRGLEEAAGVVRSRAHHLSRSDTTKEN